MNKAVKSKKISALVALLCFLTGEILGPAGFTHAAIIPVSEVALSSSFQLDLPPELGTVETLVAGQGPTIIHIQEAHGDYESQKKIESILHFLKDRYGVDLLLLEGNAFELHTDLLEFFPGRKDLNRAILEDLAKKQLASGPEFFLQASPETEAWGIEDAQQYRENGQSFIQVLKQKNHTERFVTAMALMIERLTAPYLNKDLRYFLKRVESFENGLTPFENWLSELKDLSIKFLDQDISSPSLQLEWPMLVRLFVLKEFEKRMNLGALSQEKSAFIDALKDVPEAVREGVKAHLNAPLSQNRLPDPETSLLFENMVSALPADFDYSRFPNVTLFIGHLILQSELKGDRLFDEIASLTEQITDRLAAVPREKEIAQLLKQHRLLTRLLNLELTPRDYEWIKKLEVRSLKFEEESFNSSDLPTSNSQLPTPLQPSLLIQSFEQINSDQLVKNYEFEHLDEIDTLYAQALEFYQGAQERDGTMLEKIEERMETSGKQSAAVITGGFHAGPFKEFFESKGYNYALITPKMTADVKKAREAYVGSVLANYIAPLSPAAATYRAMAYLLGGRKAIKAQGGNYSEIARAAKASMVSVAREQGLSNEEVHVATKNYGMALSEVRTLSRRKALLAMGASIVAPAALLGDEGVRVSKSQAQSAQRMPEDVIERKAVALFKIADDKSKGEELRKEKKDPTALSPNSITLEYGGGFNKGAVPFEMEDARKLARMGFRPASFEIHVRWRRLVMDLAADIAKTFRPDIAQDGKAVIHQLTQQEVEELAVHFQKVTPADILDAAAEKPQLTQKDIEKMEDDANKVAFYRDTNFYLYHYARAKVKIKMSVGDTRYYQGLMNSSVLQSRFFDYVPAGAAEKIEGLQGDDLVAAKADISKRLFFDLATVMFELDKGNKTVPDFDFFDAKELLAKEISENATVQDVLEYLAYRKAAQQSVENIASRLTVELLSPFPGLKSERLRLIGTKSGLTTRAQKELAVYNELMEFYFQKPGQLAASEDKGRSGINGDITTLTDVFRQFGQRIKGLRGLSAESAAQEYGELREAYKQEEKEQIANITRALAAYNPRLLKRDQELKQDAQARPADESLVLPFEVRFQAVLRLTSSARFGDKTERLVAGQPQIIDLIESEIKAGKQAVNLLTLLEFHPAFVQYQRPDDIRSPLNETVGLLGNTHRDVSREVKDRVREIFNSNANRPFIFGSLVKQLQGRAADREKQTRLAARSEVRSDDIHRRTMLGRTAAGLTLAVLGATEVFSADKPVVLTPEERRAKKAAEILKLAKREKIDEQGALTEGLSEASKAFVLEDANDLELQKIPEGRLSSQFKWRHLVMEIARDIVRKGFQVERAPNEGEETEHRVLSQAEAGELAVHLQTLKPEDIAGASLGSLPVLDPKDLRKLALFKDESSFLHQYAKAVIKLQLGAGDRQFLADIMNWDTLKLRLNDYIKPDLRANGVKADSPEAQQAREDLVFHLATVVFEMEVRNGAVPKFERGDAGYLVNNVWKNSDIKIIDVLEYFAYQKAAQRGVENTAMDLMRGLRQGLSQDELSKLRRSQRDKKIPQALWDQGEIDDLVTKHIETAIDKADLSAVQGEVTALGAAYKRINSPETLSAFLESYAAKQPELKASLTRSILNANPKLIEERFDEVVPATVYKVIEKQEVVLPGGRKVVREVTRVFYYHLELLVDKNIKVFEDDPAKLRKIMRSYPNFVNGLNSNAKVTQDVKDRVRKIIENNQALFASLRSEVRSGAQDVGALVLMAALFTHGVFSTRTPSGVVADELAKAPAPAVVVTTRPSLADRVQIKLDELSDVRELLAELATADRPMQIVNDYQKAPQAESLLDLVLLAQQIPALKIAVPVQALAAEVSGLTASLDGLVRKRLGLSLKSLSNFKLVSYGDSELPGAELGGFLSAEVPTVVLSAREDVVTSEVLMTGETALRAQMRVLINDEKVRGGAVWAGVAAMLDERVLAQLERFQKATDLVASQLSARLQGQIAALKAFLSAA